MELRRGVHPDMLTRMNGPFTALMMVHADWPDEPVYVHSSVGNISYDDKTWRGLGPVGNVEMPAEAFGGVVATEAVMSLVGVPVDLDGRADDVIRGRTVETYFGVLQARPGEPGGTVLVGDPVRMFGGTMDWLDLTADASEDGVEHTAQVTVITGPGARSMASVFHSDEDQRRHYPGDTAGRHVILSVAKAQKITWPEN